MKIIVGLGNPGARYERTRHNVGFLALDRLIAHWGAHSPIDRYQGKIFQASYTGIKGIEEKILLVKPQTYMNLSGACIGPLFSFYHCQPEDLIVIHDDLDLAPCTLRFKKGGGTAGHKGLKSIHEHLGKNQTSYYRIRIGIGRHAIIDSADYVLQSFQETERSRLEEIFQQLCIATEMIVDGLFQKAMNQFHQSPSLDPPSSSELSKNHPGPQKKDH